MLFTVLSEMDVLARYKKAEMNRKYQAVTVLSDLTASTRAEMEAWLKERGVWVDAKRCGTGCYERREKRCIAHSWNGWSASVLESDFGG